MSKIIQCAMCNVHDCVGTIHKFVVSVLEGEVKLNLLVGEDVQYCFNKYAV